MMKRIKSHLWFQIIVGLVLGVVVGWALGPDLKLVTEETAAEVGAWLALPGNLFLTFIRFIVIPLVISSVILGIAGGEDLAKIKKIGGAIVVYFVLTSAVSATIAITIATLFAPGSGSIGMEMVAGAVALPTAQDIAADIPGSIVALFPTNPFQAMAEGKLLHIVLATVFLAGT